MVVGDSYFGCTVHICNDLSARTFNVYKLLLKKLDTVMWFAYTAKEKMVDCPSPLFTATGLIL